MRLNKVKEYRCQYGTRAWTLALCILLYPTIAQTSDYASLERLSEAQLAQLSEEAGSQQRAGIYTTQASWLTERDPAAALRLLEHAEALLQPSETEALAYLYAERCWSQQQLADMVQANRSCLSAVSAATASGDSRALSRALNRQSMLYFNNGDLQTAASIAQKALGPAEQSADPGQLALVFNTLGRIARAQGLFDEALGYFSRGLERVDPGSDLPRYRVLAFNIGLSHADLGQFQLAQEYYRETLTWAQKHGLKRKELTALIYIANADIGLGNPEPAIESLRAAVNAPEFQFEAALRAHAYSVLGDAYLAAGETSSALRSYQQGLALAAESASRFELRELRLGLGKALLAENDLVGSEQVLAALLDDLRAEGANDLLISSLFAYSEVAAAVDDPATALRAYQEAVQLRDLGNRSVAEQRLAVARVHFEMDQEELALARAEHVAVIRNAVLALLVALLIIGYLLFARRAHKQLVALQQQERQKLDQLVQTRTAALQAELIHRADIDQQRLLLERRLAEDDKLRVLGQLTGGVAHDFNNLLTVVMGSAELLRAKLDSQEPGDRELVDHIITAATSGAGITRALMAYARQQPLRLEKTDLGRFLTERVSLLERTLGGSLSLELDLHEGPTIEVMLDGDQLTTALLNLTLNARDAQNGRGVIRILLGREDAHTAFVAVVDYGSGMNAEQIERACEPFYSTKADGRGNGLGLSMVYGFTKQLGGDLKIHSVRGEGTEIRMLLPLVVTPSDLQVA